MKFAMVVIFSLTSSFAVARDYTAQELSIIAEEFETFCNQGNKKACDFVEVTNADLGMHPDCIRWAKDVSICEHDDY